MSEENLENTLVFVLASQKLLKLFIFGSNFNAVPLYMGYKNFFGLYLLCFLWWILMRYL